MEKGKVKFFNAVKGFGFIRPNNGSKDVFVHISDLQKSGYDNLQNDQDVSYELHTKNGKSSAINLKLI
jgi:cold shock protein